MLQRGIELKCVPFLRRLVRSTSTPDRILTPIAVIVTSSTLDVSYVSSVSWYFLVSFGMRGFLSLILGEKSGTHSEFECRSELCPVQYRSNLFPV